QSLDQPKSLGVAVEEVTRLQAARIVERAPDMLTPTIEDGEPIGIVHRRAKVADAGAIDGREQEHAGHGGDADVAEIAARIERRLHVDRCRPSGSDLETVGPRHGWTIEQGMNDNLGGARRRLLDPEAAKQRELLAVGFADIEGEAARG